MLDFVVQNLNKIAPFSKVNVRVNSSIQVQGLFIQNPSAVAFLPSAMHAVSVNDFGCCYQISQQLYICLIMDSAHLPLDTTIQRHGTLAWHYLTLQASLFNIYPQSRGLFLPHHLGLQHTNAIGFNKGCYKGQEIIARMHYRATIKHRPQLLVVETTQPLFSSQKIYTKESRQTCGEVVDFCPISATQFLVLVTTTQTENQHYCFE